MWAPYPRRAPHLRLVIEVQPEVLPQVSKRGVGVLLVGQQRLAMLARLRALRAPIALDPRLQLRLRLRELLRLLQMPAQIIVVILAAGNELLDGLAAVGGEREVFEEADRRTLREQCRRQRQAEQ